MKTIKVIDLLNMIFNKDLIDGVKVKIKDCNGYYEGTYTYRENYYWKCSLIDYDIEDKGNNENMFFLSYNYDLNDEVEIIEEEKEIEKLDIDKNDISWCEGNMKTDEDMVDIFLKIKDKINELIDAVNELKRGN